LLRWLVSLAAAALAGDRFMPLDPQAAAFLAELARQTTSSEGPLTPAEVRQGMDANLVLSDDGPEVYKTENRRIPGPLGDIPIRIYVPHARALFSVVVFYHGGGFVAGNLETHDLLCRSLALTSDCLVIAVDYSLAPERKFPGAVEDAFAAYRWVSESAEQLSADPQRIAVVGDSAGGNLAAVTCLLARDRNVPLPLAQALIYPVTDATFDTESYREFASGYMLTRSAMQWYWAQYLDRETSAGHPYASPLRAERLAGLPQAFVMTAEYDPLRDEGEEYAHRLMAAGVPVELKRYPGMIHGFLRRTHLFDRGKEALRDLAAYLRRTLHVS